MPGATWWIQLFGGIRATCGDVHVTRFRTQKTAALLAYLALHPQQTHPRESLADVLWPDDEAEPARLKLRVALSSLRQQFDGAGGPGLLLATRSDIQLNDGAFTTDVAEFDRLIYQAHEQTDPAASLSFLMQAASLYRGELVPGVYDQWACELRDGLSEMHLSVLRSIVRLSTTAGDYSLALKYAQQCVALDSLREESHRDLMRIYALMGEPSAALRQFNELEQLLRSELREAPAHATKMLADKLRTEAKPGNTLASPQVSDTAATKLVAEVNFPPQVTRFFGREGEIAQLCAMLQPGRKESTRLVTVLGLGGSGKTRLALQVAAGLAAPYNKAVWFVSLADCEDAKLVVRAIADSLGILPSEAVTPLDQLKSFFASSKEESLLILDNLEQLGDDGSQVVKSLLTDIGNLRVLATSRQALGISGEKLFPLLPLPTPVDIYNFDSVASSPAVQLFVDRASAARNQFALTLENSAVIGALSEKLDGIPLAIELAATWAGILSPTQLLGRIEHRFDLLVNKKKDATQRHRSLRAVLESAYLLLPADVQEFFAELSVFRGGASIEAIEAITTHTFVPDALSQLREHALIFIQEIQSDVYRYFMLETVREYASELLGDKVEELRRKHLNYFAQLAEQIHPANHTPRYPEVLNAIESEQANIRAALDFALEGECEDPEVLQIALRMVADLRPFYGVRAHSAEGLRYTQRALDRASCGASEFDIARATLSLGFLQHNQGKYPEAKKSYRAAVEMFGPDEKSRDLPVARVMLGHICGTLGEYDDQRKHYEQGLEEFKSRNDTPGTVAALISLANTYGHAGEASKRQALYEEGIERCRPLGKIILLASALFGTITDQTDPDVALSRLEECKEIYEAHGYKEHISSSLRHMAEIHLRRGETDLAQEQMIEVMRINRLLCLHSETTADYLEVVAAIKLKQGKLEDALTLFSVAARTRSEVKSALYPQTRKEVDDRIQAAREGLGGRADAVWRAGQAMSLGDAVNLAVSA